MLHLRLKSHWKASGCLDLKVLPLGVPGESALCLLWALGGAPHLAQSTRVGVLPPRLFVSPPFISYGNVRNYYGPYTHCSLDKGVPCAQHIQLPTHTCARAWYECILTSAHISKCMQTQESLGNMKLSRSHPCWHKQ